MYAFRPRVSLSSALLLTAIAGMAIVIVQLWREVGPLRAEVKRLRDETGRLFIEDASKLHAIEVDTGDKIAWKWRVWVPENCAVDVNVAGEKIPKQGFPQNYGRIGAIESGEHVIVYRIQRDPRNDRWYGTLEVSGGSVGGFDQSWVEWPSMASTGGGIGRQTRAAEPDQPLVLTRSCISQVSDSSKVEDPAPGFMIWLVPAAPQSGITIQSQVRAGGE